MTPDILIYQDYVHNNGLLHRALAPFGHVGFCDAADILNGILDDTIRLFVMPGGADLYYCEKLNGPGNAAIRRYVEQGGRYLGICAGAYYACAAIEWAARTPHEISGPRELAFYSGSATGPIASFMQGLESSWLGAAPVICDSGLETTLCYEAGPEFSEPENGEHILARYESGAPAILACPVGRGLAALSGPHIERVMPDAAALLYANANPHHAHDRAVMDKLAPHAAGQKAVWEQTIRRLLNNDAGKLTDAA